VSVEWKFRVMTRGEINVDPIEGEFFTTEALGSLSDALVREAIQNSLDAGVPGQQVRVCISFCPREGRLGLSKREMYLSGLWDHLVSKKAGLQGRPGPTEEMDYILIEDFGTRGLEGDIREDEDYGTDQDRPKNDFFYFWRNIGRAVEGTTARGRWGLGKTVFQAASRINSFFGVTIRNSDRLSLLMGQSVLKTHRTQGQKYAPYGYYGDFENGFALPVTDRNHVDLFCRDFGLRRAEEVGLSVVVPFPDSEIRAGNVIRSTIHHYFFPILAHDLVVTVRHDDAEDLLDADSIFSLVDRPDWPDRDSLIRRLELARWSMGLADDGYESLIEPEVGKAPKWEESLFAPDSLDRLKKQLDRSERIALKVPLWVKPSTGELQHSCFKIILERDKDSERSEDHFIREGVTIAGVSSLRQKGTRVIVSVTDKPLSKLLGDSENPAHTEWQERSPKFRGKYDLGVSCLRFVKNSPREVLRILSRPAKGRDETLLQDLFYVDIPPQPEPESARTEPTEVPRGEGPDKPRPQVQPTTPFFQTHRTKGGFRLTRHPQAKALPRVFTLEVAYDVRQGNPFKRYQQFDFELDKPPIRLTGKGAKIVLLRSNALEVTLEDPDFRLTVAGFDANRDLRVRTTSNLEAGV